MRFGGVLLVLLAGACHGGQAVSPTPLPVPPPAGGRGSLRPTCRPRPPRPGRAQLAAVGLLRV